MPAYSNKLSCGNLNVTLMASILPCKVKMQYVHCRLIASNFLFPWRNPAGMSRRSSRFHSIYYFKHLYIQLFRMRVDWSEIVYLMKVSVMLYKCTNCIFTLWGSILSISISIPVSINLFPSFSFFPPQSFTNSWRFHEACWRRDTSWEGYEDHTWERNRLPKICSKTCLKNVMNLIKEVLHLLPKISIFCTNQHLLET